MVIIMKKRFVSILLVLCMLVTVASTGKVAAAKTEQRLNRSSITMYVGHTYQLKVNSATKNAVWSTTKKKVATVSNKGKVTALTPGNTTVTAKVGGNTYKCKVKVIYTEQEQMLTYFFEYLDNGMMDELIAIMEPRAANTLEGSLGLLGEFFPVRDLMKLLFPYVSMYSKEGTYDSVEVTPIKTTYSGKKKATVKATISLVKKGKVVKKFKKNYKFVKIAGKWYMSIENFDM